MKQESACTILLKLEELNDAQRKAVMHGEGPLLVLAGPGSGKTFTITQRILYLIKEMQIPPEEILVITFTKEAALSMQRRFLDQSDQTYPVNFGTFHSVFYHILNQANGSNPNSPKHREILRESQKKTLIYPIVKKYMIKKQESNTKDSITEEVSNLLSAISFYKNTGDMEKALHKLSQELRTVFEPVYKEYENMRKQKKVIDFDDMVYECAELLEKDTYARKYWQNRFTHILMDEFQDISPMQYRVVKCLAKKPFNLFAVGDDDQAIYGFRGAQPACLKQFAKDYHAEQILLNMNYRSYEEIIRASSLVIQENKERFAKKLEATEEHKEKSSHTGQNTSFSERNKAFTEQKTSCTDRVVIHTFQEREEQYRYLLQTLSEQNESESCAVLFRTNSYMQGLAVRLQRAEIPFVMKERVMNIYEQKNVKDVMAYLRLASGEDKRELWLQIMNKPSRYISREALAGCGEHVTITDLKAYYDNLRPDHSSFLYVDKIRRAIRILEKQLEYLKKATPFLAVQYVRKVIGYEAYLRECHKSKYETLISKQNRKSNDSEEWLEILEWLSEDAKQYSTLAEWQDAQKQYADMLMQNEKGQEIDVPNIHLMTVHASKGLEFDHVWIPDCNEKVFPHGSMPDKETCEEERRIFYVGMTRAKKSLELLCLTGTKERPRLISRFLNPIWNYYSSSSTTSSNSH